MQVFYLHGFASSARSTKAAWLAERFTRHGIELRCPDLNEPEFETLTVSRMIARVQREIAALSPAPVTLIGSSLGAFVAWHLAASAASAPGEAADPPVAIDRLVLLAPALDFGRVPFAEIGDAGMARWRETGWREVMHHADGRVRRIHYELFADAGRYDSFSQSAEISTLIFQGTRDTIVEPAMVERFARGRPGVRLRLVDDDHQLLASLDQVWQETAAFLRL